MISILYQPLEKQPSQEVKSLAEFIGRVSDLPSGNDSDSTSIQILYRGHSSIDYELCSSISRYKNSIKIERDLIEQAKNKLPEVFPSDQNKIVLLSKM